MEEGWALVHTCTEDYKAELLKGLLEQEDIEVLEINKKDSAYTMLGNHEIYVKEEDLIKAQQIIKNNFIE